jgi:thiol-disulfide isomerase/thioredoxin
MKKLSLIVVVASLAACTQPMKEGTHISGKLSNASGVLTEFTYFNEYLNNDRVVTALEADESGLFSIAIDVEQPVTGGLRIGRLEIPVYLEPGDDLVIEGDASRPMETINYSGSGGANNNLLLAYQREIDAAIGDRFIANLAGQLSPEAYGMLLDSVQDVKSAWLADRVNASSLSSDFVVYLETRIKYERFVKLLEYPVLFQRANQLPESPMVPEGYYAFLNNQGLFDDTNLENMAYVNFLLSYLTYYRQHMAEEVDAGMAPNQLNYHLAANAFDGLSRDFIQALMLGRELSYGKMDEAETLYEQFIAGNGSEKYKNRVMTIQENMQKLASGNPAPDFTMTDIDGNEVSLSDFRGKVVYLDFWASWCGPCMREMPHFKELKARMADQTDLVFVYVSIDTDKEAWMNTVDRHDITGVHFNTPGRERGVPALYNVKWIPSFFIIGRDGNMFDNRPPMPSDPEIDEVLLAALNG